MIFADSLCVSLIVIDTHWLLLIFVEAVPQCSRTNYVNFDLLPNELLESFWDTLWLGIRTFLCFVLESSVFTYDIIKSKFANSPIRCRSFRHNAFILPSETDFPFILLLILAHAAEFAAIMPLFFYMMPIMLPLCRIELIILPFCAVF